jgi:thiamine biosynthesis protein ThiS
MARWQRLASSRPLLIAVTNVERLALPIGEWAAEVYAGGVDLIQIREPKLDDATFDSVTRRIIAEATDPRRVQINNRPAWTETLGCGLHLPESAIRDAVTAVPVSTSVHSLEAARAASAFDFVVAGHVFSTPSHAEAPGRGLAWLEQIVHASPVPVVAIGGVDATNAVSCLEAGASGVAVIRALTEADDPRAAARSLRHALDSFEPHLEKTMAQDSMTITLNGKLVERPIGSSIQDLLHDRELVDRLVVVEVNGSIIPRSAFVQTVFQPGDIVELVHFVGGG